MPDVFTQTQEELDETLRPVINQLVEGTFEKAGFILYKDSHCKTATQFVQEFKDGRKNLVKLDEVTLIYQFLNVID